MFDNPVKMARCLLFVYGVPLDTAPRETAGRECGGKWKNGREGEFVGRWRIRKMQAR